MNKPRSRKVLNPNELLVTLKILNEAPGYEGKQKFVDWIEGSLKVAGYVRIGRQFYKQKDISNLSPLIP